MAEDQTPENELTPQERAWLDGPNTGRGYQPIEPSASSTVPPTPPPGRAGTSAKPDTGPEEREESASRPH
jgi:hypothetical protein